MRFFSTKKVKICHQINQPRVKETLYPYTKCSIKQILSLLVSGFENIKLITIKHDLCLTLILLIDAKLMKDAKNILGI